VLKKIQHSSEETFQKLYIIHSLNVKEKFNLMGDTLLMQEEPMKVIFHIDDKLTETRTTA
jgi:hypothetical protein